MNMDCVLVLQQSDITLFRHLLLSYKLYFIDKSKFIVFASKDDLPWLDPLQKIHPFEVHIKENYPELNKANHGMLAQGYLKLISFQLVTTEYFLLLDADFLFMQPCFARDFFDNENKPYWFYTDWQKESPAYKWKAGSEKFLAHEMEFMFMDTPQYVFSKQVCKQLSTEYDLKLLLTLENHTEYNVYGAYTYKHFKSTYNFQLINGDEKCICAKVNQVPPTYCVLDPNIQYSDFENNKFIVFWSHWYLAEKKMTDFLLRSQEKYPKDQLIKPDLSILYFPLNLNEVHHKNFKSILGTYPDNWLSPQIKFSIPKQFFEIQLEFMVPTNPLGTQKNVHMSIMINDHPHTQKNYETGQHKLTIKLDKNKPSNILINLKDGFHVPGEQREIFALLQSIHIS